MGLSLLLHDSEGCIMVCMYLLHWEAWFHLWYTLSGGDTDAVLPCSG